MTFNAVSESSGIVHGDSSALFPLPKCIKPGTEWIKKVKTTVTVSDGILQDSAFGTTTIRVYRPSTGNPGADQAAYDECMDLLYGDQSELLDNLAEMEKWIDPLCPFVNPDPSGAGPCQGLQLIDFIFGGDPSPIDPGMAARIITMVQNVEPDPTYLPTGLRDLAVLGLAGREPDPLLAKVVFAQALLRAADRQPPLLCGRDRLCESTFAGWHLSLRSAAGAEVRMRPTLMAPTLPRGYARSAASTVMRLSGLPRDASGTVRFDLRERTRGEPALLGITDRGVVDLGARHDARSNSVSANLRGDLQAVMLVER